MIHQGPGDYFSEFWNYNDMTFIWSVLIVLFL